MSVLQSALCKLSGYCRSTNIARFSISPYLNKQSLEERLGIEPKPKKPATPFLRFIKSIRPELLRERPDIKVTEISKIASERWKKVDARLMNDLKEEYEKDVEKYQKELKEYELRLSAESKEKLLLEKANMKLRKERQELKKQREGLGHPRKPATPFLLYLKEKVSERSDNESYTDWVSKLGKKWKELTEEQKQPYKELQKRELMEYRDKKAKWDKEMESKGHSPLLKH